MRKLIRTREALTVLALGSVALSCGPNPDLETRAADGAAIRAADISWSNTYEAGDVDAVVSYYTDDAVVMVPNRPKVVGKQAARELIRSQFQTPGYSGKWQPEQVEVAQSGDLGYSRGHYSATWTSSDGTPITDTGKYIVIWKKQPDDDWKVAVDILNSDLPPVPVQQLPDQDQR